MNTSQRRPAGLKLVALVVGGAVVGVAVLGLLVVGLVAIVGSTSSPDAPPAPSNRDIASGLCASLDTDPAGDRYSMATRAIPPDGDLGRVGTAQSYRQAARLVDGFCPRHYNQAELLRGMARIYDPSGG